jgi:hypothetical protein
MLSGWAAMWSAHCWSRFGKLPDSAATRSMRSGTVAGGVQGWASGIADLSLHRWAA